MGIRIIRSPVARRKARRVQQDLGVTTMGSSVDHVILQNGVRQRSSKGGPWMGGTGWVCLRAAHVTLGGRYHVEHPSVRSNQGVTERSSALWILMVPRCDDVV